MLHIDRNALPGLPRPVFEINAEKVDNAIRLTVMVSTGHDITYMDIEAIDADTFERSAKSWLLDRPYFDGDDLPWAIAVADATKRISIWLKKTSMYTATTPA
ncbi:hypothetical protein [Rhodanobacter sp. A1T4]|uniref:hypothetical protein n=1 Tax=Rhodanobacter sp. A1T4 TaxID=2723087 RepID=UPI001613931D|nr:hypothetical protein [Rhodanobacter sp. A1T4]MBB6249157.1 hypothetical protein [Rhodanobacter sp. A1T4]